MRDDAQKDSDSRPHSSDDSNTNLEASYNEVADTDGEYVGVV